MFCFCCFAMPRLNPGLRTQLYPNPEQAFSKNPKIQRIQRIKRIQKESKNSKIQRIQRFSSVMEHLPTVYKAPQDQDECMSERRADLWLWMPCHFEMPVYDSSFITDSVAACGHPGPPPHFTSRSSLSRSYVHSCVFHSQNHLHSVH